MFFLPVEFGAQKSFKQTWVAEDKSKKACQLKFTGDVKGSFLLIISQNLLVEAAQNFLGESRESLEQEHLIGTLTEMLNMFCGNTLSKIDTKAPFELGIPKIIDKSDILDTQVFTIVETTGSRMAISIVMD
ncbi:MAG: chemotaxis protein CheX [Desulfobacteraceae bacterium]|nr:chemotaxis protein CheX [Desulfobacteraceae bacterium]